jgi:hypothetical protein
MTDTPDLEHDGALAKPEPPISDEALERVAELAGAIDGLPLVPNADEVRQLAAIAVVATAAGNVPKPLRGKPNDAFMVLLEGRALGLAPTTALRMLHVIDGTVTVPPKVKLALVRQAGLGEVWPDAGNDGTSATWHATRDGRTYAYTFTMADARAAELDRKDNWRHYPGRMLSWRALGYLLDDVFPDVGTGLYAPDELGALTDEDGLPIEASGWEAPPGMNRPQAAQPPAPVEMADDDTVAAVWLRARRLVDVAPAEAEELRKWWQAGGYPQAEPGRMPAKAVRAIEARLVFHERKVDDTDLERWEAELVALDQEAVSEPVEAQEGREWSDADEAPFTESGGVTVKLVTFGEEPGAEVALETCAGCGHVIGEQDGRITDADGTYHAECAP